MIIFCAGMYRSGSTLQYQITADLVEGKGLGSRVEWKEIESLVDYLNDYNSQLWRVVKTHEINERLSNYIQNNSESIKVIYIYRDLRDVFLSHMIKNNLTFDELFASNFLNRCIYLYEKWTDLQNIYIARYENVFGNLKNEVINISKYLNIEYNDAKLTFISKNYSFENQMRRTKSIKKVGKFGQLEYDKINLLHPNHLNKGEIGAWKNYFTKKQKTELNTKLETWLIKLNYII